MFLCRRTFAFTLGIVTVFAFSCSITRAQEQATTYAWHDPEKIVRAEKCKQCHELEHDVWEKTAHYKGYDTLHKRKPAENIKKKMGFKTGQSIKREILCLKCHYTATIEYSGAFKKDQLKAISGVSCESCHGAARDWIDIHNDYGTGFDDATEPTEHRQQRIQASRANGMFRPSDLYDVVANCFQCHTVPHERLVNVGRHSTGSRDFEFLARMELVRHNFLAAQFDRAATRNVERSQERKRVMYVVGAAVDLEHSVRGIAEATENKGRYIKSMQSRRRRAEGTLRSIADKVSIPEIEGMLKTIGQVNVKANNRTNLENAAEKLGEATQRFIASSDGSKLAALDRLISGDEVLTDTERTDSTQSAERDTSEATSPDQKTRARPSYEKKRSIRPRSAFKTIGPDCASCHSDEYDWWVTDSHHDAAEPLLTRDPEYVLLAEAYGMQASEIANGNQLCADCHATVITGDERHAVEYGVSCESCHGPAGDYKEPHSVENPPNGYSIGKDYGMVLLEDLDRRANACAQCHYITDPGLISVGHPTGTGSPAGKVFDFVERNREIRHWKEPIAKTTALVTAFEDELQRLGPVPDVEPREDPDRGEPEVVRGNTTTPTPEPPTLVEQPARLSKSILTVTINDSLSIEEKLLILKKQLERLHYETRRKK